MANYMIEVKYLQDSPDGYKTYLEDTKTFGTIKEANDYARMLKSDHSKSILSLQMSQAQVLLGKRAWRLISNSRSVNSVNVKY